jgi:hypothetical protein
VVRAVAVIPVVGSSRWFSGRGRMKWRQMAKKAQRAGAIT